MWHKHRPTVDDETAGEARPALPAPSCRSRSWTWLKDYFHRLRKDPETQKRHIAGTLFAILVSWVALAHAVLSEAVLVQKRYTNPDLTKDDLEYRQVQGTTSVQVSAVLGAITGFMFGPFVLLWGYQIQPIITVFNAFMSSGIGAFMHSVEHMHELNAERSGGRFLPQQARQLLQVMLAAFTLSVTAIKIEFFSGAMMAGVAFDLMTTSLQQQVPPVLGCVCAEGTVACGPLREPGLYGAEPACYGDWWVRFGIKFSVIGFGIVWGMNHAKAVLRLNLCLLGSNFCCNAIFDTILAISPQLGARLMPWRQLMLFSLGLFGFKVQGWLQQLEHGENEQLDADMHSSFRPALMALSRTGHIVMAPFYMVSKVILKLRTFGQDKLLAQIADDAKEEQQTQADAEAAANEVVHQMELKKQKAQYGDSCSRSVIRLLCFISLCFGIAIIALGNKSLNSQWIKYLSEDALMCLLASGALVTAVSVVGLFGSQFRSRLLLTWFSLLIVICMALQLTGAIIVYSRSSVYQGALQRTVGNWTGLDVHDIEASTRAYERHSADALAAMHGEFRRIYDDSKCSAAPPLTVSCTDKHFERFINTKCVYYNATDVDYIQRRMRERIDVRDFEGARGHFEQLVRVSAIARRLDDCVSGLSATVTSSTGVFCACRAALVGALKHYALGAAHAAVALSVIHMLILICCCTVCRTEGRINSENSGLKKARRMSKKVALQGRSPEKEEPLPADSGTSMTVGSQSRNGSGKSARSKVVI